MSGRFLRAFIARAVIACLLVPAGSPPAVAGGTLRVASDVSYAPLEFYRPNTKQIEGFDYDLAQALGKRLGEAVDFRNHDFATMIPDLKAGKFDVVVSAMSDTRARERDVDFIDYLLSGSGILTKTGNPAHLWDLATLCGHRIDLEKGTSQELAVAHQQGACKAIGLGAISVVAAPTDEAALKAFQTGNSDAHISDYPVVSYVARTTDNGKAYTVVGHPFGIVPFGIAVAKKNTALRDRVQKALLDVIRDGTYDTLLRRWGLEQGALRSAPVNAGTKYERPA
ncbi:MAG TPA: ABC transporter substrate-binding protein [Candidatus Elarobacter sp.]|jgi:polar amino acid transport system substrate-binding protein